MNILLTGATGFLGKYVLEALLQGSTWNGSRIFIISRKARSHPDPRVHLVTCDLSQPGCLSLLPSKVDVIIHLAAQYNLFSSYHENYLNNVVATQNVARYALALGSDCRIVYASTYAHLVGSHDSSDLECREPRIRSHLNAYPSTKHVAEKIIIQLPHAKHILRFGVLVGDSKNGYIESLNGPYYAMKLYHYLAKSLPAWLCARLPQPGDPLSLLPFVPIDCAAAVIVQLLADPHRVKEQILAVIRPDSLRLDDFYKRLYKHLMLPRSNVFWRKMPVAIKKIMDKAHLLPADLYDYLIPQDLAKAPAFSTHFPAAIPHFDQYETQFFSGFTRYLESGDL